MPWGLHSKAWLKPEGSGQPQVRDEPLSTPETHLSANNPTSEYEHAACLVTDLCCEQVSAHSAATEEQPGSHDTTL